jgi:hypothetical protein
LQRVTLESRDAGARSVLAGRDVAKPGWNFAIPAFGERGLASQRIQIRNFLRHAVVTVCPRHKAQYPVPRVACLCNDKTSAWSEDTPHFFQRTQPKVFGESGCRQLHESLVCLELSQRQFHGECAARAFTTRDENPSAMLLYHVA